MQEKVQKAVGQGRLLHGRRRLLCGCEGGGEVPGAATEE
jgi:hypothetical protein